MKTIKMRTLGMMLVATLLSCGKKPIALSVVSVAGADQRAQFEAFSAKAMVSAANPATSKAALDMFKKGGNIIDAFVAASFTISVERPHSTGIGGGGFLVFHEAKSGKNYAFDFRERAPILAHEKMFLDLNGEVLPKASVDGILAAAVPGLVKGVYEIHLRFGKLPWKDTLSSAIALAENGFPVYEKLAKNMEERKKILSEYPASKEIFLKKNGGPYKVGDILVQKDLAATLREIAAKGSDGFYKGRIAKSLIKEEKRLGGLISQKDLEDYQVKNVAPIHATHQGYDLYTMPPPSSGGVHVIEMLNILENFPLKSWGPQDPRSIHVTTAAMQLAFRDRADHLGDPEFYKVPTTGLISKKYAKVLAKKIKNQALKTEDISQSDPLPYESNETSHFSIMDIEGNMVASTQTINGGFGSGVVVPETGFLLNNEMDDFSVKPGVANMFGAVGGEANKIQAKKTPLSSMSPTLILKNREPVLAIGSPGGPKIITCNLLSILNYLDHGLDLFSSVAATRYHHQWKPDELKVDAPFFSEELTNGLKKKGYDLKNSPMTCLVMAVAKEKGQLHGVSDPRGEGLAIGY